MSRRFAAASSTGLGKAAMPVAAATAIMAGALFAMPAEITRAGSTAIESLAALMHKRSPGDRSRGDLVDSKARRHNGSERGGFSPDPAENPFVAKIDPVSSAPLGSLIGSGLFAPLQTALLPETHADDEGGMSSFDGFFGSGGGSFPGVVAGGDSSGGGSSGGGGGSSGGSSGGGTVTALVPEPATWLMLVFGFGIVGYSLRARRLTAPFSTISTLSRATLSARY